MASTRRGLMYHESIKWFGFDARSELARIDSIANCCLPGVLLSLAGLALMPWLLKWMERLVQSWCREAE